MNCSISTTRSTAMVLAWLLAGAWQTAWAAPGEDPIALEKKVTVQMQPLPAAPRSSYIYYEQGIPAWQQARLTRYVAKAFSSDTTGIYTEKDVIHAVDTKGSQVVCSQSVGSNVAAAAGSGKASPGVKTTGDQVVVLRGDLVNICW